MIWRWILFYSILFLGHGGTEAAQLAGQRLHNALVAESAFSAGRFEDALRGGFATADKEILEAS